MDLVVAVLVYKLAGLAVGVACVYMGYRLFMKGVFEEAAESIEAKYGKASVLARRAAPGTIFALFGAAIIVAVVFKGWAHERATATTESSELVEAEEKVEPVEIERAAAHPP